MGVTLIFILPPFSLSPFLCPKPPLVNKTKLGVQNKIPPLSMGDTFQNPQIVSSPIYTMILPVFAYL